jgi:hypothetical protein
MNETNTPAIVVLSSDGGWGKAKTLAEAFSNCPYKTSKSVYSAYACSCSTDEIEVDGMGSVHYPRTATSIHLGLFKDRISQPERNPNEKEKRHQSDDHRPHHRPDQNHRHPAVEETLKKGVSR